MKLHYQTYAWACDICGHEGEKIVTSGRPKIYPGWKVVERGTDPFTTKHINWGQAKLLCPGCYAESKAAKKAGKP